MENERKHTRHHFKVLSSDEYFKKLDMHMNLWNLHKTICTDLMFQAVLQSGTKRSTHIVREDSQPFSEHTTEMSHGP